MLLCGAAGRAANITTHCQPARARGDKHVGRGRADWAAAHHTSTWILPCQCPAPHSCGKNIINATFVMDSAQSGWAASAWDYVIPLEITAHYPQHYASQNENTKQDCLLQGQAQLDQRVVFRFFTLRLRGGGVIWQKRKTWSKNAFQFILSLFSLCCF